VSPLSWGEITACTPSPRFETCPGILETRCDAEVGIPAFAYGAGRLDVSDGPDEFIDESAVRRCAAVYALFAGELTSVIARVGTQPLNLATACLVSRAWRPPARTAPDG
jgi:hypothetical protein